MKHNNNTSNGSIYNQGLIVLEWNEHIQRRPGMYIPKIGDGSNPEDGIYTLLKGVLAGAVDEFPKGYSKGISVELKDGYASVRDYGKGIPLESVVWATSGVSVPMGATKDVIVPPIKVTNALSFDFYVVSYRDGEYSWAKYSKGYLLDKGEEKTAEDNGTFIKFRPDPDIFVDYAFRERIVKEMLQSIVRQNKGLTVTLNGAIVADFF